MTHASRILLVLVIASAVAIPVAAQVATGTPAFGSFGGGPEVINLANLNAHLDIPVTSKSGRGLPFTYDLVNDTSVWYPVGAIGNQFWQPIPNWGWAGQTQVTTGYVTYSQVQTGCNLGTRIDPEYVTYNIYTFINYYDQFGRSHSLDNTQLSDDEWGCPNDNLPGSATITLQDGSGFKVYMFIAPSVTVYPATGGSLMPPLQTGNGAGTAIDRNGNEITVSGGVFTDTLGTTALTVAGSGTPSSPMTFTYTAPSGANAAYTIRYTAYTVQTKFNCSGISEYGPTSNNLVSEIDLPDGSKYSFAYEPTPGVSGKVTGRLASVTLPTGGTLSYSYSGGGTGVNGISCADGSGATITRTTPDGTWTYAHSESGAAWNTLITDPQGNQTNMNFQGIYETQRQVYQGTTGGTLLRQWTTCYNGNTTNCNSTAITLPITQRTVTDQYGTSGLQCKHNFLYNSVGSLTEQDDYDYGSGAPGALLRQTLITFASLGNITAFQQQVTVKDGNGNIKAQTNYNYDETAVTTTSGIAQHISVSGSRGNLTSVNYPVSGLTSHFTYYDTGSPKTSQDVNGATTTYNYSSNAADCQMAFPTSISEPLSLSRSMTWNCTGGVQLTATDENNQTVTTSYSDPYFWRPASVTDPLSNSTTFYYQPNPTYCCPWAVAASLSFNNGNSLTEDLQYKDGLGRTYVDQHPQSPGSSTLDSVSYAFDSKGRPYSVSVPCAIGYAATCSTPKTTQTYDALDRPLVTTDGGGGTVSYSYFNNDILVTVGPAPSGENTKRHQLEYDALGRLTSVCELTGASGSGTCGQSTTQTGYWTKYSYDALGNLLTVTQNAQASSGSQQTRSYSYDAMSRLTSETNPESGTKTYVYDTDSTMCGNGPSTSNGDLLKTTDAVGNCVMRYYDALHRVTDVGDVQRCQRFRYDNTNGVLGTIPSGVSVSNKLGHLVEAETDTCAWPITQSSIITDEWFGYSVRSEISDLYQSTPHSGGYYHLSQTYWPNGAPNVLGNNIVGLPAFTYGADGEGRTSTVSASSGQNPVTSTAYNMFASPNQLSVAFGSGDSDVFTYDPNTFRVNKYQFNVGSQAVVGTLGWNANGSLGSLNITDPFSTANTQNCSFAADDLSRISQASCGTVWGQNFSYDPFGNIQKNGISGTGGSSFTPTYQSSPTTNRVASVGGTSVTYDANGNSLNDTFRTFTWDADSNPITIGSVSLTYDAFDRMVEQSVSGTNSEIVYSPGGVKLALMSSTTLTKAFVPLTGGATAVYNSSGLAYYRHTDHLGSSRFASTPSQTLYADYAYAPFGEPYASSGAIDPSFTGKNQDTTAGLYDFLYREHDPNQTRWSSPDPAGLSAVDPSNPQSWNRYAYVTNNPLNLIDALGTCPGGFAENRDPDQQQEDANHRGGPFLSVAYPEEDWGDQSPTPGMHWISDPGPCPGWSDQGGGGGIGVNNFTTLDEEDVSQIPSGLMGGQSSDTHYGFGLGFSPWMENGAFGAYFNPQSGGCYTPGSGGVECVEGQIDTLQKFVRNPDGTLSAVWGSVPFSTLFGQPGIEQIPFVTLPTDLSGSRPSPIRAPKVPGFRPGGQPPRPPTPHPCKLTTPGLLGAAGSQGPGCSP